MDREEYWRREKEKVQEEYERREEIANEVRRQANLRVDIAMAYHYPEQFNRALAALEESDSYDHEYATIRRGILEYMVNAMYLKIVEDEKEEE